MTAAQMGEDRQAIQPRQQDIHQHHVESLRACHLQALLAVLAPRHLKAAAPKVLVHIRAQHRVIFNGQDTG